MFKVSFKETPNKPFRVVTKAGRETTVILRGTIKMPDFWHHMPMEIVDWIGNRTRIEGYEDIVTNTVIIYSTGKAKCMEGDAYNSLLGERIAESRAKYYIYKFLYDLCSRLYEYHNKILFGKGVVDYGDGDCIASAFKKYEGLCIRESHHLGELLNSNGNG